MRGWTYGAELELSDWSRLDALPVTGMGIDQRDVTMVNSDGVAVDPRGELYHLGGEILTTPSATPSGVADQLAAILQRWPQTTVNYRSNLHVHVRIPGLREDLQKLKLLQSYAHRWLPEILPILEPIPEPTKKDYPLREELVGARKRYVRRRVSHHSLMKPGRLNLQLEAQTVEAFRELEVADLRTGALYWAIHPRLCFNLRQLWETDTIEFRHFPGTVNPKELQAAVSWCEVFLRMALMDADPTSVARPRSLTLPTFLPYDHWLETGYRLTSRKYQGAEAVRHNIEEWLRTNRKARDVP